MRGHSYLSYRDCGRGLETLDFRLRAPMLTGWQISGSLHSIWNYQLCLSRTASREFLGSPFSTFFFTPSLRLKFAPSSGVSPFVSAGGGLGRFKAGSTSDNHGAFQVGGGLDFKTPLPLLGFRFETRDFVTGSPSFSTLTNNHLNNLFVGGGITLHF